MTGSAVGTGASRRATVVIDALDDAGRGVGRIEGKVVFVEGALPGETGVVEVVRRKPMFDVARAVRIERPSADRVVPRCPHFGVCGGCSMQHASIALQVAAKQRALEEALARIGGVRAESILPPIIGPSWGYRHRARLAVRMVARKGGALVGFHERRSSYVADMTTCEVLPREIAALLVPLRRLVEGLSIANRLPQIEVAVGARVSVLVLRILEPLSNADAEAVRAFADAHGVQIWLQPGGPATASAFHPLDAPALDYALPEFGLRIGFLPTDFTQVNHAVNAALVQRAMRLLEPGPGDRIHDLFCGLGNFALPMAVRGATVAGFEGHPGLVERALANARQNGLTIQGRVADLFDAAQVPDLREADKLLIDPPREGAVEVVKALPPAGGPGRIVYVSCDAATLARDAGVLVSSKGYRLVSAGIVNMFPHTSHVESIALFERA